MCDILIHEDGDCDIWLDDTVPSSCSLDWRWILLPSESSHCDHIFFITIPPLPFFSIHFVLLLRSLLIHFASSFNLIFLALLFTFRRETRHIFFVNEKLASDDQQVFVWAVQLVRHSPVKTELLIMMAMMVIMMAKVMSMMVNMMMRMKTWSFSATWETAMLPWSVRSSRLTTSLWSINWQVIYIAMQLTRSQSWQSYGNDMESNNDGNGGNDMAIGNATDLVPNYDSQSWQLCGNDGKQQFLQWCDNWQCIRPGSKLGLPIMAIMWQWWKTTMIAMIWQLAMHQTWSQSSNNSGLSSPSKNLETTNKEHFRDKLNYQDLFFLALLVTLKSFQK